MLNIKEQVKLLKDSEEFKEYKKKYPDSYMSAGFLMYTDIKEAKWQIDFYCPKEDKIVTFLMNKKIEIKEADKVFQKEKTKVNELELSKVKISFEKAIQAADAEKEKRCSSEGINQVIVILQNLKSKNLWNITYLTSVFNFLNVKIDSENGDLIEVTFESVLNFNKK